MYIHLGLGVVVREVSGDLHLQEMPMRCICLFPD